jgi:hypothetical protein
MRALSPLRRWLAALVVITALAGCLPTRGGARRGSGGSGGSGAFGGVGGFSGLGGVGGLGGMTVDPPPNCSPGCGVHARCLGTGTTASCLCAAGYFPSADGCVWGGLLQDPGFQDLPAGAWTIAQGAALAPRANGPVDPGELQLDMTAICSGGTARQTVTMPSVADAEPLALRITQTSDCWTSGGGPCAGPATAVTINGATTLFGATAPSGATMACLGERAYGGTYDIFVGAGDRSSCALGASADVLVDHLDIEPSAGCPVPGTLPDGDFEATQPAWTAAAPAHDTAGAPPVAEIQLGAGSDGSRAGHFTVATACDDARLQGLISPPLAAIPNLAVQLAYHGTGAAPLQLALNGVVIGSVPAAGPGWSTARACVPEGLKGTTVQAALGIAGRAVGGGSCAASATDFVVDDLRFVSDHTCPATAWLLDGDFERPDAAVAVQTSIDDQGRAGAQVFAGIDDTATHAFLGTHALKLSNDGALSEAVATFPVSIPPTGSATLATGPALTFWYKAPALASSSLNVQVGPVGSLTVTAPAADYTQVRVCLDRTTGGQTGAVTITLAGAATADSVYPVETVWLDDFAIGTSPACATP